MAKARISFVCSGCGHDSPKWMGQCPKCKEWHTFEEFKAPTSKNEERNHQKRGFAGATSAARVKLKDVSVEESPRIVTGIDEFDRVLGGGITQGSATLISGDPGAGKSTLLLQIMDILAENMEVSYITGEESLQQIADRASRLKLAHAGEITMMAETEIDSILKHMHELGPKVIVVDSIQAMYTNMVDGSPGGPSQVKECAQLLTQYAKATGCALFLVGHVTKDQKMAGPKMLEHIIDISISLEGGSDQRYRMLRAKKNRFGAVNELGCFAMMEEGLKAVSHPSKIFLSRPERPVSGSVVAALWEGTRPLLVEIQALSDDSNGGGNYRRTSVGIDSNRLSMLLAILNRHGSADIGISDVFVNVVGGIKIIETATDLAVILAFVSSVREKPIPQDMIIIGELGLSGELRPVPQGFERLKEAQKHGFKRAIVPKSNASKEVKGMKVHGVHHLQDALSLLDEAWNG